jgi:squalene-hopene/tetraprenyl-beta-curcumene cyclase
LLPFRHRPLTLGQRSTKNLTRKSIKLSTMNFTNRAVKQCFPLAAALIAVSTLAAAAERTTPPGWDMAQAAQYLDDRMDLRFAKATQLPTDQGKTACVSCHSVVPYALARPALRRAMGVSNSTPQEVKLLDETQRRVATYASNQPLYANKAQQSRGTEAVLNALILANQDAVQQRSQPSEPTRQAFNELWERQRPDGAWDWLDSALEPYESKDAGFYGATLAALAVGTAPGLAKDRQGTSVSHVSRLRLYLKEKYGDQNLYNRACLLLAASRLTGLLTPAQRDALMVELQERQQADGGWSLYKMGPWRWSRASPPDEPGGKVEVELLNRSDGYATGLIAYTLRQAGLPPGHPALQRAKDWLKANQRECLINEQRWKCWRTYSLNNDREHGGAHGEAWPRMFMSDSATAFAALALLSLE